MYQFLYCWYTIGRLVSSTKTASWSLGTLNLFDKNSMARSTRPSRLPLRVPLRLPLASRLPMASSANSDSATDAAVFSSMRSSGCSSLHLLEFNASASFLSRSATCFSEFLASSCDFLAWDVRILILAE